MARAKKTHCVRGHEIAVVGRNSRGRCRECQRTENRRYNAGEARRGSRRTASLRYAHTEAGRFSILKAQSRLRGIDFRMSLDEWRSRVIGAFCHYGEIAGTTCSMPPTGGGLDRKDPSGAYDSSNVVPCCHLHNSQKGKQSYEFYVAKLIARRERAA